MTNQHNQQLLDTYQRRLQILELQAAQFGINTPPHIVMEIEDLTKKIKEIENQINPTNTLKNATIPVQITNLSNNQKNDLVDLLLEMPSLSDRGTREVVLARLPKRITNSIVRHTSNKTDVSNILQTVLNYKNGLEQLVGNIRFFDDETRPMKELDLFISELGED
ncbi:MAG: hypothetical protein GFH27_549289n71 [Chloroflexi bacterium AL-W]|nr:hypothetical protein [Chloroflexi bacterium AL-N1]NOK66803.1 hypothetical protein [Chloroflexi bacterium AL-N10]NOK74905.1 hypothetical protein [Chloroflexi bacterium AL-N5]NOK81406.1 hypothetical protein [Chloroflexi bacterium AL-W]NOK88875.1 hypothetical protein [Chloroflexi bacterium AL-N15]